jgi:lipopolysaccharide export LptBFGC system permease protein LptF
MSLLIGTVLVFARASQDREITAIRSAGISPRVPMTAALLVGVLFSLVGLYAMHQLIPAAHFHKYRVVAEVVRNVALNLGLQGDKIAHEGIVMTWRERAEGNHFKDVLVHALRGHLAREADGKPAARGKLYTAREAFFESDPRGETLKLRFVGLREPATGMVVGDFAVSASARGLAEKGRRHDTDRDMSSDHLLAEVYRGVHPNANGARFTVNRRSCFALMPALLAPLAFAIGVAARDRGRMTALLFCLPPLVVFFGCDMLAQRLVQVLDVPLLGFLPVLVVGLLGLPFVWRWVRF